MSAEAEFEHRLALFRDPDPGTRRDAAEALSECSDESEVARAVEALVEGLRDSNPGVQEAALSALVRIGGARVVRALIPLLRQDVATRNLAVEILEQIGSAALELLLPLLTHPDPNLRKFIIDTLNKLGDRRAIPALRERLCDEEPNVRGAAAEALGAMRAVEAVPSLLGMLQDEEWVVFSVVEALGTIAEPATVCPLLELMRTGSEAVRFAAIEALGRFPEAGICVPPMLAMLPSADPGFRDLLVKSIVSLGCACGLDLKSLADPDRFVPALAGALESEEEDVVSAAIKGFGMMEDRRGAAAILSRVERACGMSKASCDRLFDEAASVLVRCADEAVLIAGLGSEVDRIIMLAAETLGKIRAGDSVQGLARLVVTHINREVRRVALEALGKIGDPAAVGAVMYAVTAVSDETGYVRGVAASVLGRWGERLAIEPLCRQLVVERYAEVRAAIVEALCAMADPVVSDRLIEFLRHPSEEVREGAARGLGKMRAPAAFQKLRDASRDASCSVRAAVAEAVGRYAVKAAFEALLQALSDDHEKVRLAAVMALATRNEAAAMEAIREHALTDQDVWVRYRAAEALGGKRVAAAVPALLAIAQDTKEPDILRRMAVQALGLIGDERATDTIKALLADNDQGLAAAAEEALNRLLGGAEGDDPWK